MSNAAFAKTKPVNPPTVNRNINATAKTNAGVIVITPPHIVANQLKTLIPVGIAIIIVADEKKALVSTSKPTVYI